VPNELLALVIADLIFVLAFLVWFFVAGRRPGPVSDD